MKPPQRVVLFVEGEGDRDALPLLVTKLFDDISARNHLFLDGTPWVVGHVAGLTKDNGKEWIRLLNAASRAKNIGAVLLLLDGEDQSIRKESFCAGLFARRMAQSAKSAGAGKL